MSQISITNTLRNSVISTLCNLNTAAAAALGSGNTPSLKCGIVGKSLGAVNVNKSLMGQLAIMKGAVPNTIDLLADAAYRSTDILLLYSADFNHFEDSTVVDDVLTLNTNYLTPISTGVATWFWFRSIVRENTSAGYNRPVDADTAIAHQFFGTVGITGTGSDLEIPNTSLTTGNTYRISNLKLRFPGQWTY